MKVCALCGREVHKNGTDPRTGTQKYWCPKCKTSIVVDADKDMVLANLKLAKQKQNFQDSNRIERKAFREWARIDTTLTEITKEFIHLLKQNSFTISEQLPEKSFDESAGAVIHLSDLHFNELVDLPHNQYNYKVASQRLKTFADKCKGLIDHHNVHHAVIAITGDILNSDRRLDELMNNAGNRTQAMFVAVDLLQQFIRDIASVCRVSVVSVSGNESRVKDEHGMSDVMMTDNYDYAVHNILKHVLPDIPFHSGDPAEIVFQVAGQNILACHGERFTGNIEKEINSTIGRYAQRGTRVDYVIFGHTHSARIGDSHARCSSMVGSNTYAERGLNLIGRASQNIYFFYENGNRDGFKVDLQNPGCDLYAYNRTLEAYNTKSKDKLHKGEVVFQVIV
jgi:predicted phosphodiesterase